MWAYSLLNHRSVVVPLLILLPGVEGDDQTAVAAAVRPSSKVLALSTSCLVWEVGKALPWLLW